MDGVDLDVDEGEIVGLIGPNGSGKTTLVNVISGALRPSAGRVVFDDEDATRWSPQRRCHWGLARTRQVVRPLADMTVFENVLSGALFGHQEKTSVRAARKVASAVLDDVGLAADADSLPGTLPIQRLKLLEMARALASAPRVLMLDETLAGQTPDEASRTIEVIRQKRREGVGILFIEHRLPEVLALCDRIYVLNAGRLLAHGGPEQIAADPAVMKAYLGVAAEEPEVARA